MALRSGYKGFKKVINGIKVFRPGVLGLDLGTGLAVDANGKLKVTGELEDYAPNIIANTKLIKDTVGWSGKNKWVTDLFTTTTAMGYTATVDPITKKINITGTHDTETAGVIECGLIHLEAGTYKLSGGIGGTPQKLGLQVWASSLYSDQWYSFDNSEVTMTLATAKDCKLRVWFTGVTSNVDVTFEPMIRSADILDDTYEPYSGSTVETILSDHKTTINAIINAATGAADFAAFKTAMGALTPVTRSLSKEASPEDVPEEVIEEEKTVTKKTTRKSTVKEGE